MSAQHLTPPHSAEKIEASHHTHSSEGHQVPGPPHSHGHDAHDAHHDASSGKVIAVISLVLLLGGAAWIGVRAPDVSSQPGHHGAGPSFKPTGPVGVVVLKDGREFAGRLSERERSYVVQTAEGEVVVPKALVEDVQRGSVSRPMARGGGIVVTTGGEVFVGRVREETSGDVTVSWPYGDKTFKGEITVPRERVRWKDTTRDTLGDEYWRAHPRDPIQQGYRPEREEPAPRQPATREREGAARPSSSTPRDRRNAAVLAHSQSRWADAATAWARVYADSRMAGDLKNLLTCTDRMLAMGFESDRPTMQRAQELLSPFRELPLVRQALADAYVNAVGYHLLRKQVPQARRWALALQALGGTHAEGSEACLRAVAQVEHDLEEEEAEEHEEHGHPEKPTH